MKSSLISRSLGLVALATIVLAGTNSYAANKYGCKTPYGTKPELIVITKNQKNKFTVTYDNIEQKQFDCVDRSMSRFTAGLVVCNSEKSTIIVYRTDKTFGSGSLQTARIVGEAKTTELSCGQ